MTQKERDLCEMVGTAIREAIDELRSEAVRQMQICADCQAAWAARDYEFFRDAGVLSQGVIDALRQMQERQTGVEASA